MKGKVILSIMVTVLITACSTTPITRTHPVPSEQAAPYDGIKQELSDWIGGRMADNDVMGLSLALVDDGTVVWAQGFGYADRENNRPATANTLYKAGSISKLFTATAIMQLEEQGKVDLDAPIQTYIPELQPRYHRDVQTPITLRHIMRHRSGLPGDKLAGMFAEEPERFDTVIEYLNQVHAPYEPGTVTAYSNVATDLLGVVVERVSGLRFEDYVDRHLFEPLGMTASTFRDDRVDQGRLAKAYQGGMERSEPALRDVPAGNLYTSALELSHFATMAMNRGAPLLQPHTQARMVTPPADEQWPNAMGVHIGLNWIVNQADYAYLGPSAGHSGSTFYHNSAFMVLPEQQLGIIVLTNSLGGAMVAGETADKVLKAAARVKTGLSEPELPEPSPTTAFPDEVLANLPGHYAGVLGAQKVVADGDGAKAYWEGLTIKFKHHENGWLSPHPRLFGFIPLPIKQITQSRLRLETSGEHTRLIARFDALEGSEVIGGVKVTPYDISEQWHALAGEYRPGAESGQYTLFQAATVIIEDGFLFVDLAIEGQSRPMRTIIRPLSPNMAVLAGEGRWMQETLYVEEGANGPTLIFSGVTFYQAEES